MDSICKTVDFLSLNHENISIMGDFNVQEVDPSVKDFCDTYSSEYLFKESTCYKNHINPKFIDFMLTN